MNLVYALIWHALYKYNSSELFFQEYYSVKIYMAISTNTRYFNLVTITQSY